ncbi:hypothetical protein RR48_14187 [Papilio machaon]|uniref:Uncharacterized protein n=1 Tax=Papilio machaon TaxID=76193 RepID=A0A194QLL3_PAPMA|nr:hypothetical protein RR48_14187 [Papilio machaon]
MRARGERKEVIKKAVVWSCVAWGGRRPLPAPVDDAARRPPLPLSRVQRAPPHRSHAHHDVERAEKVYHSHETYDRGHIARTTL